MADKKAAPPGTGPAITSIESTTTGGTSITNTTDTVTVNVADLQAKLDAQTKRADDAENRSLGLRRNLSTRDRELEQYRQLGLDKLNQTPGYLDPGINTPDTPPQGQGMSIQEREEHDQLKYRVKHSDWKTYEDRQGPTRALLSGERTGLNFLQTLSGTATMTRKYVAELHGTRAKLLDTRKTIPGLRSAQKYAVRCGGGHNHRIGLYDGILIKENHLLAAGSIQNAVTAAKAYHRDLPIEVEVETPDQIEEAIEAGADIVLLDNFTVPALQKAVALTRGRVKLEASGGIKLSTAREVAATGVDFISVGSLTKHVRAIDISMHIEREDTDD